MVQTIKFHNKTTRSFLRNGYIKTIGLDFSSYDEQTIMVTAVNSRNNLTVGHLAFPKEDIPEIVKVLEKIYRA